MKVETEGTMTEYFVVFGGAETTPRCFKTYKTIREALFFALKERERYSGDVWIMDGSKRRLSACEMYRRLKAENWSVRQKITKQYAVAV